MTNGESVLMSDDALVDEIHSGSTLAFGVLMKRYEKLVYRIAFNHAKNPDCAMDITQNVFLKAHKNLTTYSGAGIFKAWLLRITYNESISWFRQNKNERATEELTSVNAPVLHAVQVDEIARQEYQDILFRSLEKLRNTTTFQRRRDYAQL